MKVCVMGLWHLGCVTAACLAEGGHDVIGLDLDEDVIRNLRNRKPPLFEPGLEELLKKHSICFTSEITEAVKEAEVIWITYDTPVDEEDRADIAFVMENVKRLIPYVEEGTLILVSSQLPIGSTCALEKAFADKRVTFAYSPENLRLGKAISVFMHPDRVVVGSRKREERIEVLLRPFTNRIEWMSIESAEMTKHALNAFLATSIVFINEIATLCERVGADAKEVERALKSEERIGSKAPLSPGGAFAGGTLARDISFLKELGKKYGEKIPMLASVQESNAHHKEWVQRKLLSLFGNLHGKTIAVWGLTYKPKTDTLRRSTAIELCRWLVAQGARVQAHDPAVKYLPGELQKEIVLCVTEKDALAGADGVIVATPWPQYREVEVIAPVIIDPNRFLDRSACHSARYVSVGVEEC